MSQINLGNKIQRKLALMKSDNWTVIFFPFFFSDYILLSFMNARSWRWMLIWVFLFVFTVILFWSISDDFSRWQEARVKIVTSRHIYGSEFGVFVTVSWVMTVMATAANVWSNIIWSEFNGAVAVLSKASRHVGYLEFDNSGTVMKIPVFLH